MSELLGDDDMNQPKSEHGTMNSYIVGFVLSLIFTAIPYYLVVSHAISGNILLATILLFAVLQMFVQVIFFLHLGRERGPRWQLVFFAGTVGIILMVVVGSLWIMSHLHYNMAPADTAKKLVEKEGIYEIGGEKTGACHGDHKNYVITIENSVASPSHTTARKCDTLTFTNKDKSAREITFGSHPQHGSYAGETEVPVRKERNKTITLSATGTYQFHDHFDPKVTGSFTVIPQNSH